MSQRHRHCRRGHCLGAKPAAIASRRNQGRSVTKGVARTSVLGGGGGGSRARRMPGVSELIVVCSGPEWLLVVFRYNGAYYV